MADTQKDKAADSQSRKTPLTRFKYVGGKDAGVNEFKSRTYYDIQFPLDREVEVPDNLVHKLRLKDDLVEVDSSVDKSYAEEQRELAAKEQAKSSKAKSDPSKLTPEEVEELRAKAAKEDERIAKVQADAKAGR